MHREQLLPSTAGLVSITEDTGVLREPNPAPSLPPSLIISDYIPLTANEY